MTKRNFISNLLSRRRFLEAGAAAVIGVHAKAQAMSNPHHETEDNLIAHISWSETNPPLGQSPPYVATHGACSVLKMNKYAEACAELDAATQTKLRRSGPMTISVAFQLHKQWPMRAALVSRWDYMPSEASYELGITPPQRLYFRISADGSHDGDVREVITEQTIGREEPIVVSAVFEPSRWMALYVNGKHAGQVNEKVPKRIFDSETQIRIGQRFEGLLAGVWFHSKALNATEIRAVHETASKAIPPGTDYKEWQIVKRKSKVNPPSYLGTTAGMKLVKEIDISAYAGCYVCPGDLTNEGRLSFLLYRNGSAYTAPGRLIAIGPDGRTLWQKGDLSLAKHADAGTAAVGQPGTTPALRGISTVYDIDEDGRTEVISELWEQGKPMLYILDAETGEVKHRIASPLDMSIRQPLSKGLRQPSRSHPVVRIARLRGADEPPSIVIKYGASSGIDCHAFALDSSLNVLWHIEGTKNSMGHVPTVVDIDGDGCDEVILGHMLADHDGKVLWDHGREFEWHADTTVAEELIPGQGKQILISVCGIGPVYCLSPQGEVLWRKTREEVEHGQAVWVGNFLPDLPGKEAIVCARGHVGHFITCKGSDGTTVARFDHFRLPGAYPDFPTVVNWLSPDVQSLWLPQDRTLVDGRGQIVAELGDMDSYVQSKLHCGTSWRPVGAQAFALDVCGDQRQELVLYEPYAGESIFVFTQPDSDSKAKPYRPQKNAYNIRSYF